MDAIEAILTRRVQRAFADRAVALDDLNKIVEAGRHAMSARNLQPWQFVIIRDRETLKKLGELCTTGRFIGEAPAAIAILKDLGNKRWADVDCAQAVQNMADVGWALGLGTCWAGNFEAEKIVQLLGIPVEWGIFTILPFGYTSPAKPPEARPLKSRKEMVHYERYGNPKP
jgi:nitroreductase